MPAPRPGSQLHLPELLALLLAQEGRHLAEGVDPELERLSVQTLELGNLGLDRRIIGPTQREGLDLPARLRDRLPGLTGGRLLALSDLADGAHLIVGEPQLLLEPLVKTMPFAFLPWLVREPNAGSEQRAHQGQTGKWNEALHGHDLLGRV
jgi:hypothetical protein